MDCIIGPLVLKPCDLYIRFFISCYQCVNRLEFCVLILRYLVPITNFHESFAQLQILLDMHLNDRFGMHSDL